MIFGGRRSEGTAIRVVCCPSPSAVRVATPIRRVKEADPSVRAANRD